jgi:hypothetical protein
MAYDKKSDIGNFVAQPGNQGVGQADLHKQSFVDLYADGQTIKVIDMLDMDQFGHNVSKLRKSLSVLEAEQCNTDREYGVIQIEDDFNFANVPIEPVVDPGNGIDTGYTPVVYAKANGATVSELANHGKINLLLGSTTEALVLPQIVTARDDDIYGLQCFVKNSNGVDWDISGTKVTQSAASYNLSSDNIVTANGPTMGFTDGGSGRYLGGLRVSLTNNDTNKLYELQCVVGAMNSNYQWNDESTAFLTDGQNEVKTVSPPSGWAKEIFILIVARTVVDNVYVCGNFASIRVTDRGGDHDNIEGFNVQFDFKDQSHNGNPIKIPACSIEVTGMFKNGVEKTNTTVFSKTVESSLSDIAILSNVGSVFDWAYRSYTVGKFATDNISFNANTIKTTSLSSTYLIDSGDTVVGLIKPGQAVSNIVGYYKLLDVSSIISIGIIKRSDSSAQIAVKYNNRYVTAQGDTDVVDIGAISLREISIINFTDYSVSFVVKINGSDVYYSMFTSDNFDGNKLISNSRIVPVCISLPIKNSDKNEYIGINSPSNSTKSIVAKLFAVNDDVYAGVSSPISFNLAPDKKSTAAILPSKFGLQNSIIEIKDIGAYVSDNLLFYVPNHFLYSMFETASTILVTQNKNANFMNIASVNAYNNDTDSYSTLPLRIEDEYPEIYNRSKICSKSFMLGKTSFIFGDGTIYESGSLSLCPNSNMVYISEPNSNMYQVVDLVLIAKGNVTNVYTFSELGFVLLYSIEDEVITTPVKISIGAVCVGRNNIWIATRDGCRKIWKSNSRIIQASLTTKLDNSCIAVIDDGSSDGSSIYGQTADSPIITQSGGTLSTGNPIFKLVTINQFGYVSFQQIQLSNKSANFLFTGPSSDLLIIDTSSGAVGVFEKRDENTSTLFSIKSNQHIEYYGDSLYSDIVAFKIYYTGSGTIQLKINGVSVGTKTVNSASYSETVFNINTPMSMISYEVICSSGVKVMQRMLGVIAIKGDYYV